LNICVLVNCLENITDRHRIKIYDVDRIVEGDYVIKGETVRS